MKITKAEIAKETGELVINYKDNEGKKNTINLPSMDKNGKVYSAVKDLLEYSVYLRNQKEMSEEEIKKFNSKVEAAKNEVAGIKKSKRGIKYAVAIGGVVLGGVLIAVGLEKCADKHVAKEATSIEDTNVKTIPTTSDVEVKETKEGVEVVVNKNTDVETSNTVTEEVKNEILADGIDTTLEKDDVLDGALGLYTDAATLLQANGKESNIDFENITTLYTLLNYDNLSQNAFSELIAENRLPENEKAYVLSAFGPMDIIGHEITDYIYGEKDAKFDLAKYVVDKDNAKYLERLDKLVEETRNLPSYLTKEERENKEISAEAGYKIYEEIYNYLVNKNDTELGNYNNTATGLVKVVDNMYLSSIIQGLGRKGYITQEDIEAVYGTHKDPATGEEIDNTPINDWSDVMMSYNSICGAKTK